MYLRSIMIVFRDMKPENVLIFNTSLDSPVSTFNVDINMEINDINMECL